MVSARGHSLRGIAIACLSVCVALGAFVGRAGAAAVVGTPIVTPAVVGVGQPTTLTVTVRISDPSVIAASINAQRLDASNGVTAILGALHDDGLNGDAVAGDGVFTLNVILTEPTAGELRLRVSAAFRGLLRRVFSDVVTVPVIVQGLSSIELIDRALARGDIDTETALIYRVFAEFGDDRLPAQYRGGPGRVQEIIILREVRRRFSSLSPSTRAVLAPFLLPPSAPGSWLEILESQRSLGTALRLPAAELEWHKIPSNTLPIKVWWRHEGDEATARAILREIETTIWPALVGLMGQDHVPLPDLRLPESLTQPAEPIPDHGDDDRFDIYLVHLRNDAKRGYTQPYGVCGAPTPSYMVLDSRRALVTDRQGRALIAHELMHAFQLTYGLAGGCDEYQWLLEATATWAEDFVYHDGQTEHFFAFDYLVAPDVKLEAFCCPHDGDPHAYGAYLWFFYLSRQVGFDKIVPRVLENAQGLDSLHAIEKVINPANAEDAGFGTLWPEFALLNWNQTPVDQYQERDPGPPPLTRSVRLGLEPIEVTLERGEFVYPMTQLVEHLAAQYYHFRFTDPSVRSVAFFHLIPTQNEPTMKIQALIKTVDKAWRVDDFTEDVRGPVQRNFCLDIRDERLEELVIIISNSDFDERKAIDFADVAPEHAPKLIANNIGCWRWRGSASATIRKIDGSTDQTEVTAATNLVFERQRFAANPQLEFYRLIGGTATWTHSGVTAGCSGTSSGMYPTANGGFLEIMNYKTFSNTPSGAYDGVASTPPAFEYTIPYQCPRGGSFPVFGIGGGWLVTGNGLTLDKQVGPSGSFIHGTHSGSVVIDPGPGVTYTGVWEWQFTAERQP